MKIINFLAALLVLIGALNWGLVGVFGIDLVQYLVGGTGIDRLVYILVGVSALWQIFYYPGIKKCMGC